MMRFLTCLLLCFVMNSALIANELTRVDEDGLITIIPPEVPEAFRNPSTSEFEADFRRRYNLLLNSWTRNEDGSWNRVDQRRFFESEKWSYPHAMLHVLAGNVEGGMRVLQLPDQPQNPRDHDHTLGIDLWAAFTLKGQVRKFFQFRHLMEAEYRERMTRAIDLWTQSHPRHTPHPIYERYNPREQGWGPNRFGNRQLDGRRTDNLFAMSTAAVYLFAEYSGNEETRQRAKSEILGYVWALYNIGHGEWDSTAYHHHVFAPYLGLYDFAQDPEVRMAAKLALDHFSTAIALKSHRTTFAGASKRDYHPTSIQGGEAMRVFWMYFGGPDEIMQREHTQLFVMASGYRPPPAVLALANREIDLPVEIRATKPTYENWHEGRSDRPRNFETLMLGRTYTAGSVVSPGPDGDLHPFRIVFDRGETATNTLTINSEPFMQRKHAGDQVAQRENVMVWLRETKERPFRFLLAEGGAWEQKDGVWFLEGDDTWFALRLLNLGDLVETPLDQREARRFPNMVSWLAEPGEGPVTGFALEIGERGDFDSFEAFVRAVHAADGLVPDAENVNRFSYTSTDGRVLTVERNTENDLPIIHEDGVLRDWDDPAEWALGRTMGDREPVISLGWKEGDLDVRAGGHHFQARFRLEDFAGTEVRREDLERERNLRLNRESGFENLEMKD